MVRIVLLIITFVSSVVSATELYELNASARALGMGNAYTAFVAGADALFYNPAGLSKTKGVNWRVFGLQVGADGMNAYQTAQKFQQAANFTQALRNAFGQELWFGGRGESAFAVPGFGGSVYDAFNLTADLRNPALPTFDIGALDDFGVNVGMSMEMVPGWDIGFVASRIQRIGSTAPIGVATLATLNSSQLTSALQNRGVGYGLDFGTSFTMPTPSKTTFSFVWKNAGYTSFTKEAGASAPPMIPAEMIAGFASTIDLPALTITPALDYKYMNRADVQMTKKINFGVEFALPLVSLRGGFSQGYYTLGVGVNLGVVKVDLATYGVELGEYGGQQQDRRYMVSVNVDLSFDPHISFGSLGNGGGGQKQRR